MNPVIGIACCAITNRQFVLLRFFLIDWIYDRWGSEISLLMTVIMVAGLLFLDWKQKQAGKSEGKSVPQDDDHSSTTSTSPPDE